MHSWTTSSRQLYLSSDSETSSECSRSQTRSTPSPVGKRHTHASLSGPVPSYCLCPPRPQQTTEPTFFLQTRDIVQRKQLRGAQTRPGRLPLIAHHIICHFSTLFLPSSPPPSSLIFPPPSTCLVQKTYSLKELQLNGVHRLPRDVNRTKLEV